MESQTCAPPRLQFTAKANAQVIRIQGLQTGQTCGIQKRQREQINFSSFALGIVLEIPRHIGETCIGKKVSAAGAAQRCTSTVFLHGLPLDNVDNHNTVMSRHKASRTGTHDDTTRARLCRHHGCVRSP